MCRILFVKDSKEFGITGHLEKFAFIAKNSREYQGHGWGCSYLENGEWKHYHSIKPVWEDDLSQFGSTLRLLAHARSAFEDRDIRVENNMPFYDDDHIFIFNGELRGVKINAKGRIGAEKIFNFIKRFKKHGMEEAVRKGTEIIRKRTSYLRAMNLIIANKEEVWYSSYFNEDPDYFTMKYRQKRDELVICSEAFPGETGWENIEKDSEGKYS